jgi:thioredoxin 1
MSSEVAKPHGEIVRLTEGNFGQMSGGTKPLLVDFWAAWCGPCRMMEPAIERLATKYSDKVTFGKVNVDEEMNLSSKYQVFSIPTFMIFKGGSPVDTIIGAVGEGALDQFLKKATNGQPA